MKKSILSIGLVLSIAFTLNACSSGVDKYELPSFIGEKAADDGTLKYDNNLFYRNDNKTEIADPFVLDNTKKDGYYYLYGTVNVHFLQTFHSKDLENWEPIGYVIDNFGKNTEIGRTLWSDIWAPEIIYDEAIEKYVIFFSATPDCSWDKSKVGKGVVSAKDPDLRYLMFAATSDQPYGPFQLLDFTDADVVGQDNVHKYNKTAGNASSANDPYAVRDGNDYYEVAYPQYWTKYMYLNPQVIREKTIDLGVSNVINQYAACTKTIDPHPFLTKDGAKYLYFTLNDYDDATIVCGMEMENWLKPKYETFTVLTRNNYYTVKDWEKAQAGEYVERPSYEERSAINEGSQVLEHEGKYYLSLSINSYKDQTYQVIQAVSDNPLGPFRKLTEDEGGVLLSTDNGSLTAISGPGHHSFIERDGKTYIAYHKHNSVEIGGSRRHVCIDEVKWISASDIDGKALDVLYVNGPTSTIQPRFEFSSGYKNVATDADIALSSGKLSDASSLNYLTDGLLSLYTSVNEEFIKKNIKETVIESDFTLALTFNKPTKIRAIMLYNSKNPTNLFTEIKRVEFETTDKTYFINNVKDWNVSVFETSFGNSYSGVPGSFAYAEFDEISVTKITLSVQVPTSLDTVGLSEIRVLGK